VGGKDKKELYMDVEKYKSDIKDLVKRGNDLYFAMQYEQYGSKITDQLKAELKDDGKVNKLIKGLPSFLDKYQEWYSESLALLEQLLPSRVDDFVSYYKLQKSRKEINPESYNISDYLQGLSTSFGGRLVADQKAAIPKFKQQLKIVESLEKRFVSTLFEIRSLVQFDLLDNELDSADYLLKNGFVRAAGAIVGVVLEEHLSTVCSAHELKFAKKELTIADYNDALKKASVIDVAVWRNIQYLGDIRNLCDHKKTVEPKSEQVEDLIIGARKVIKTVM
jgi:hypothetical protein